MSQYATVEFPDELLPSRQIDAGRVIVNALYAAGFGAVNVRFDRIDRDAHEAHCTANSCCLTQI